MFNEINRGMRYALAGALAFGTVTFGAGVVVGNSARLMPPEQESSESDKAADAAPRVLLENNIEAVLAAEGDGEGERANSDSAVNDLYSPPPPMPVDRELQLGQKHAVELNEMICRQTGQNCEEAKLFRRQYLERYGR